MQKPIKKFNLEFFENDKKLYMDLMGGIVDSGFLAEGPLVKRLEGALGDYLGVRPGVLVGSGTDALQAAYMAAGRLKKTPDSHILIPSNTFVATELAASLANIPYRYVDVDAENGMLTVEQIKQSVTASTFAVVFVHIGGSIPDELMEIKKYCQQNNLLLIEDAAHCMGSSLNGVVAGDFGDMGCFSFFPTKTMTMGEGGYVISKQLGNESAVRAVKNFGRTTSMEDVHEIYGFNMKVTEMQAALGLVDLSRLDSRLAKRRKLFETYLQELRLGDAKVLHQDRYQTSSCYKIILRGDPSYLSRIEKSLASEGIPLTGKVYSRPLNRQAFHSNDEALQLFPNAEEFTSGHICPVLYPELDIDQIKRVSKIINKA